MPQIPYIHFQKKRTEKVDWVEPLKKFIQATSIDENQYINVILYFLIEKDALIFRNVIFLINYVKIYKKKTWM